MIFLLAFSALLFVYSLYSRPIERFATAPLVFTLAGILAPEVFPELRSTDYHLSQFLWVAEIGLVLLLFTEATRTDLGLLRRIRGLPARLLGPGMLMTIALGALVAHLLFPNLLLWEACVIAATLAPTDAGLGQVIVSSPRVPERIREALNVEAGLNDGLAVPFLLFFIGMLGVASGGHGTSLARFIGEQLGYGVLIGAGVGWIGGRLLERANRAHHVSLPFVPRAVVMLPVFCILLCEALEASMFIAAFVAGLAVQTAFPKAGGHAVDFAEQWGQLFNLSVFFLFGLFVDRVGAQLELVHFAYALLSLTVVRMLPVAVALAGSGLSRSTKVFMGWFGPRGLASIVLGLVVAHHKIGTAGEPTIHKAVIATVLLSIVLHGLSAQRGIAWYKGSIDALPKGSPEIED